MCCVITSTLRSWRRKCNDCVIDGWSCTRCSTTCCGVNKAALLKRGRPYMEYVCAWSTLAAGEDSGVSALARCGHASAKPSTMARDHKPQADEVSLACMCCAKVVWYLSSFCLMCSCRVCLASCLMSLAVLVPGSTSCFSHSC